MSDAAAAASSPFHRLDDYIALSRIEALTLAPDGGRAVATVATLNADGTGYERALWQIPTTAAGEPQRLTRSAKGERAAAFTGAGQLLFVSARANAAGSGEGDEAEQAQLWLLPRDGGEAQPVTKLPGGLDGIAATARDTEAVVIGAGLLPSAGTLAEDARLRSERRKRKVSAILHERYPVRYWDHDLGPDRQHLFALRPAVGPGQATAAAGKSKSDGDAPAPYPAELPQLFDVAAHTLGEVDLEAGAALSPDGRTLVAVVRAPERRHGRDRLAVFQLAEDGTAAAGRILVDEPDAEVHSPVFSHDGRLLAYARELRPTPAGPTDTELWIADADGGNARRLAPEWDRWPNRFIFDHDDRAIIAVADEHGRAPIFRIPFDGSAVERVTDDEFAYSHVEVAPGGDLVALRSSWLTPPHPVRLVRSGEQAVVTVLPSPVPLPEVPGHLDEVEATAEDGTRVRGWLVLPEGASEATPAPLLLWVHGGPVASWNAWSWRWNPWIAAARGYAVLLPDPALSTGYGREFVARGWNAWGAAPFTDLLAITDAALERQDLDASRTAALGGSFGGYVANWLAGHTDRFRAIVSHASLWALDQFQGTTDHAEYWARIFTPEAAAEHSPHHSVAAITTPLLIIHGDRDYRVPIGESLRLWSELAEHHAGDDGTTPHRFLYFPDENHWILAPQHTIVWYETVFAFLAQHVHGEPWQRPGLLG